MQTDSDSLSWPSPLMTLKQRALPWIKREEKTAALFIWKYIYIFIFFNELAWWVSLEITTMLHEPELNYEQDLLPTATIVISLLNSVCYLQPYTRWRSGHNRPLLWWMPVHLHTLWCLQATIISPLDRNCVSVVSCSGATTEARAQLGCWGPEFVASYCKLCVCALATWVSPRRLDTCLYEFADAFIHSACVGPCSCTVLCS